MIFTQQEYRGSSGKSIENVWGSQNVYFLTIILDKGTEIMLITENGCFITIKKDFGGAYMLDERKVKLMTQLAQYDQTQGKEDFKISEYYRKDYAGVHIL